MKRIGTVAFLIIIILIVSCKKEDEHTDIEEATPKSGFFVVKQTTENKSNNCIKEQLLISNFDLGEIKRSKRFYFSLSNGGDEPIFDIQLNCNNNQFNVTPNNISVLNGINNQSLNQIIEVDAIHGENLDGLGYDSLMNKGVNECILSIIGKTLSENDTIDVNIDLNLNIFALVTDFDIYSANEYIDFSTYENYGTVVFADSCQNSGLNQLRTYSYNSSNFIIENTGNVPISISIFNRQDMPYDSLYQYYNKYIQLDIGEVSDTLEFPLCTGTNYSYELGFKVNSNATISDINKLEYGLDGNIYFVINNLCE